MASDADTRALVCTAIDARRRMMFAYEGHLRVVEPHLCGRNSLGHDVLTAWLVRGYSRSGAPGWRTYLVNRMLQVKVIHEEFPEARRGYDPEACGAAIVYCRLRTKDEPRLDS